MKTKELSKVGFVLKIDKNGWPPAGVEWLFVRRVAGGMEIANVPIFVKGLAVGDVVQANLDKEGKAFKWKVTKPSLHSTVWLAELGKVDITKVLKQIRKLGCNTDSLPELGCHAIDVPPAVPISRVDRVLGVLDKKKCAVAYPAFRHKGEFRGQ